MGLCLVPVRKRHYCFRGGETHARSGLHQTAMAAQQVKHIEPTKSRLSWDYFAIYPAGLQSSRLTLLMCVSGTSRIVWTLRRSVGWTPPPLLRRLPVTVLVNLWHGTLSAQTGAVCIMSKLISNLRISCH